MKEADLVPYRPIVKAIFYLHIVVGLCLVGYLLWTGVAVIPKKINDNFLRIEREQSPFSYWLFVAGISFALIGLPIRYLRQGGVPRSNSAGTGNNV